MPRIGTSDLDVHPLGLGGNTFGMTTDAETSEEVLDAFVAGGGDFVDTADSYSFWVPGNTGGESETIIGQWMRSRGNRDEVVVATKVSGHPEFKGLAPDNIANAANASLKRLQTDHIDLYYAHYDDESTPLVESLAAFDSLVRAGKVRYVGVSNYSAERVAEWISVAQENGFAPPVALQPNYSLVNRRDYERDLADLAERHRLGVFPYFSLASGFLTGKYRTADDLEGAARGAAVKPYMNEAGLKVVSTLESVASARGASIATTALAWLLAKPTVTAPLASATTIAQLSDLLAAPELRLNADEVAVLDEASRPFT
ncbi:MAG: aldo/keto reductase [Nocardiopsaceae bacterium]|nr:aldo/keto reductase [Nocardiopsaceae bacterium]